MQAVLCVTGTFLLSHHVAALMHVQPSSPSAYGVMHTQVLTNFFDVSYTGTLTLGGQKLKTIFDSGSFELVVLSKDCSRCGSKRSRLFNSKKSPTYKVGNLTADCTYGSGMAYTEASYDDAVVEAMGAKKQFFWKVYDADQSLSSLFSDNAFAAICGVGPSQSVEAFAEYELQSIHKEVQEYKSKGGFITPKIEQIVQTFEAKLELAKTTTTVLDNIQMADMSVCLGKASGSPGYFTWNDIATKERPELFLEVPVVGDFYWSAELNSVQIGAIESSLAKKWKLPEAMTGSASLGCQKSVCSAVIDTGTTLIVAPSEAAYAVEELLYQWGNNGGNCKDLSVLPNLEFNLGGKAFTLPPEAYVAEYTGTDWALEQVKHLLPHLYKRHKAQRQNGTEGESYSYCSSLISPMDADSQFGPLWIIGMSFFREYYTTFHLVPEGDNLKGASMSFSSAGPDCKPNQKPGSSPERLISTGDPSGKRKAQLRLDVSKIRVSPLVERVHGMAKPKIPGLAELREQFPVTKKQIVRI